MELNRNQLAGWLRVGLAAGGPLGALIIDDMGLSQDVYNRHYNAFLYCLPLVSLAWDWWRNRKAVQLLEVKKLPEIATVVVKDKANGTIGQIARDTNHPDIVTESQNAQDVKNGKR